MSNVAKTTLASQGAAPYSQYKTAYIGREHTPVNTVNQTVTDMMTHSSTHICFYFKKG